MKKAAVTGLSLAFTIALLGCSKGPTDTARSFSEYIAKGQVSEAKKYSTEPTGKLLDTALASGLIKVDPDAKFIAVEETIDGNTAIVKYRKHEERDVEGFTLVKLDGKWMIDTFIEPEGTLKIEKAKSDITALSTAILAYRMVTGDYPSSLTDLTSGNDPFLYELPMDPWGAQYYYLNSTTRRGLLFEVFSLGADGVQSGDDIGNWNSID